MNLRIFSETEAVLKISDWSEQLSFLVDKGLISQEKSCDVRLCLMGIDTSSESVTFVAKEEQIKSRW